MAPQKGLVPLRGEEGNDYVAVMAFTIVAERIFFLFTREKESQGTDGKIYPPLEKFPGGGVLVDDRSLSLAAHRELGQETSLLDPLEITWDNTVFMVMSNREGPGEHRKVFFTVRMDRPRHPDMQLATAPEVEEAFWAELSPGRQFPIQLPRAHREALDFARQNLPIFQVSIEGSGLSEEEEAAFLAQVRTIEPQTEGEAQPLEGGFTPFQLKELRKQETRMKKRHR